MKTMSEREILWDSELRGFGARKLKTGITYILKCRVKGQQRWLVIGTHGSPWSLVDARKEALRLLYEMANGGEPVVNRQAAKEKRIGDFLEVFLAEHEKRVKPRTFENYVRECRKVLGPNVGKYPISSDIKLSEALAKLHKQMGNTPRAANSMLQVMSIFSNWAEAKKLRPEGRNPVRGIRKYKERKRERYLSSEELVRLGEVLEARTKSSEESPFVISAVWLLIFTGARLEEVLSLKWTYVDRQRRLLLLPDSKTGKKVIRLNTAAMDVLDKIPRIDGNPYVIVGSKAGARLVNLQKPWRRIRKAAGIEDVRLHDLRHSYASELAAAGGSLPMIGRLLGHTQPVTTARYAHLKEDPLDELNDRVGEHLRGRMGFSANGS